MKKAKIYTPEFYAILNNQVKFTNEAIAFWQGQVELYPDSEIGKQRLEAFKTRAEELAKLPR